MPEDQSINGDIWTEEANHLLKKIGWEKIADSNIDVPGTDGYMHGIDSIFTFFDGFRPNKEQAVFLEAKRYLTSSFNGSKFNDWIRVIDLKIRSLKDSQDFFDRYPSLESCNVRNALLVVWFHDFENYPQFREKIDKALMNVKLPGTRGGSKTNKLFVLTNDGICKLASIVKSVSDWNRVNYTDKVDYKLRFHYPASILSGFAIRQVEVLNLEYIFSKFILAKGFEETDDGKIIICDVVFYFGELDMKSFYRLHQAMLTFDMLSSENKFYLYTYKRNDEFRKIKKDVKNLFEYEGPKEIAIKTMEIYSDLPSWIKDQTDEI